MNNECKKNPTVSADCAKNQYDQDKYQSFRHPVEKQKTSVLLIVPPHHCTMVELSTIPQFLIIYQPL